MLAPVILSVVSFIAGHPTQIVCDQNLGGHQPSVASGFVAIAYTEFGGSTIYAVPSLCDETNERMETPAFAHSVGTFIHEAAHARGVRSESCAEMTADTGSFDVLRRFYDVPFFSTLSSQVGFMVLTFTRARPADYQPERCWGNQYR